MNCTECGYNLAGVAHDAPCPECGGGRDASAIARARARRDSISEKAIFVSIGIGIAAGLTSPISWSIEIGILLAGVAVEIVAMVAIWRAGRAAPEFRSPAFRLMRTIGIGMLRLMVMTFACGFTTGVIEMIRNR